MPINDAFREIMKLSYQRRGKDPALINDDVVGLVRSKYKDDLKSLMTGIYEKEDKDVTLINDDVVNKVKLKYGVEDIKEEGTDDPGFFNDLWSSFKAGGTKATAGIVQMLKPLAGASMSPSGPSQPVMFRGASGELEPATPEQLENIQKETQRMATDLYAKGNEISSTVQKFDKGIWENIKSGNFADAGKQTAFAMSESMASMIPIMINAPAGIATMGVSATGTKQLEMKEEMRLGKAKYTPKQIWGTSLAFGAAEVIGDVATAGMFKGAGKLMTMAKSKGKDATKEASIGFIKSLLKGSGQEGSGEVATQMGQNLADNLIADKDVNLMDGTIDAFIIGNVFSSSTMSGAYISGKALSRISPTSDRQKVAANMEKVQQLEAQKQADGVSTEQSQILTDLQQNIAQENVDIFANNRANANKMTPEQKQTLNELSKSSEKIDLLLTNENLTPGVIETLTEQKLSVEGRKQELLTSIDEDIKMVIQEDAKTIPEDQKKLDYLKKQGEPYEDLTIKEIRKRYDELTEKPAEAPTIKKQIEPKKETELAALEKRFKDPEIPMTKSEYRAEEKKITQKIKEDAKEVGKEVKETMRQKETVKEEVRQVRVRDDEKARLETEKGEKLEVEIIKPKKKQPKDIVGTSASEWVNAKNKINKSLKGVRGTTELKGVPRQAIKTTLQKFADENVARLTTPQKTAIDKAIGSDIKTRADLNKVLGIMEKSFAPKKRVLIDAWGQQKRQYKEAQRVTRETQKYAKENIATVLSQVKQFTKDYKAKLTANQYNAIVARLGKAIKDPKGLERTLDYVDKVIADKKYALNFEQAQVFKKNLAKKMKTKEFKKNFAQQMPIIRDFLNLNPNTFSVEDIAEYNKIAINIAKGKLDPEAGRFIGKYERRAAPELDLEVKAAKDIKSMNKVLQTIDEDIKNIQTFDEYKAQSSRLNTLRNKSEKLYIEGTITDKEFDSIQDFIERIDSSNEKRLGILQVAELDIKLDMADEININKAVVDETILPEGSKEIYQDLNRLSRQQITDLPLSMVNKLNNAVYNLSNGNITADLFNVHNYIQQQQIKTKGIDTVSDAILNTTSKSVKKLTKNVKKLTEALNLKNVYLWDYVLNTEDTRTISIKIFKPLVTADTKAEIKRKESTHKFNKALNKFKNTKFIGKQKSLDKIGILRIEKRYRNNPIIIKGKAYKWKDVPNEYKNKHGFLLRDIASINAVGGYESNAYQNINKAYTDLTFDEDGTLNIDKSIKNLSSIEKQLYNASTETFDDLKGLNQSNAIKAGELWVDSKEYTPEYVIQGKSVKGETETTETETNKIFDKPYQPVTKISGAIYRKTGQIYFAETDISKVVNRHARETTHNAYINDAYTNINAALATALNELEATPKAGAYVAVDALRRAVRDNVIHTYVDKVYQLEQISKIAKALKSYARTRLLVKPVRPAAELTSNLAGAVITNGINPLNVVNYKDNAKYEILIQDEASPLINKISKYTEMQNPNEMGRVAKMNNSVITVADNTISKPIFIKNFNKGFKDLTGQEFNIDKYLSDVDYKEQFREEISESTSFGEVMVSEEFNALSSISQATKTKIVPWGKAVSVNTTAAKIMGFMMSFNTQEAAMARIGLQQIARGNVRRGTAIIAGRIVRNTSYSFVRNLLTYGMMAAMGEKDEDKLAKMFSPENYVKNVASGTMSLLVGRYGNVYRPASGLFLGAMLELEKNAGTTGALTQEMNDILNMIQYTKPIKQFTNVFDAISYVIPAYAVGVEDAFMGTVAMSKMGLNILQGKGIYDDEQLLWETTAAINNAITFAFSNPFTPVISDFAKKKSMKKKKTTKPITYKGFIKR